MADESEHKSTEVFEKKSAPERRDSRHEERREDHDERRSRDKEAARRAEMVVIDLGTNSSKDVRDLRKGRGGLMDDVKDAIKELQDAGALSSSAQPVVVIVERRVTAGSGRMIPVLLPPGIPAMFPFGLEQDDDDRDDDDRDDNDD